MRFSLSTLLTLLLVALKTIGVEPVASWSWWWVLSPTLFVLALIIGLFGFAGVVQHIARAKFGR